MKNYILFLDESKPTGKINHFCLGGCIIEELVYTQHIIPYINTLKTDVFGSTNVILHEKDIRDAKDGWYKILRNKAKRDEFWNRIQGLFSNGYITTLGTAVNCGEYTKIYSSGFANEEYFVAMQIILENFTHFLIQNDGIGKIYIESRNNTEDNKLTNHYHTIVANGTLFIHKLTFQKRLTNINFLIKADNNLGLQVADFIPNPLNRYVSGLDQKKPSLFNLIDQNLYDGNLGLKSRLGFKQIP